MPFPLSPIMLITVALAMGIWAAEADLGGGYSHLCVCAAVTAVLGSLFALMRWWQTWRWGLAAVCLAALIAGYLAFRLTFVATYDEARTRTAGTTHVATVTAPPVRTDRGKWVMTEVDGIGTRLWIADSMLVAGEIREGTTILFRGKISMQDISDKWGRTCFMRGEYAYRLGVSAMRIVDTPPSSLIMRCRVWLLKRMRSTVATECAKSLTAALLLADRSGLDRPTRAVFRDAGASHLLALSGMHLGVLMALLHMLLGHSRRHSLRNALIITATLWAYVLLAASPLSLVRAATMQTILAWVLVLRHHVTLFDALWTSLFLMLIVSPFALFDVGAQMSYACMFAIAIAEICRPESHHSRDKAERLPADRIPLHVRLWRSRAVRIPRSHVLGAVATGAVCTVGTMPLTVHVFGTVHPYSALSGIAMIPLTLTIIAATAVTIVCPAPVFCLILSALVELDVAIAEWFASLPFATIDF